MSSPTSSSRPDNVLGFYCTTSATSFRYRGKTGIPELSPVETGFSRNQGKLGLGPKEVHSPSMSTYKTSYKRGERNPYDDGVVHRDDLAGIKTRTPFSKQNQYDYVLPISAPTESESQSSYKLKSPSSSTLPTHQGKTARFGTASNGYTRNFSDSRDLSLMKADGVLLSEFESAFAIPVVERSTGDPTSGSKSSYISGFSKSCTPILQVPANTKQESVCKSSYTKKTLDAPYGGSNPKRVESYCSYNHVAKSSHSQRKGGVYKRADQEGNVLLHKPYLALLSQPTRPGTSHIDEIPEPPQHHKIAGNAPMLVADMHPKGTHWRAY